MTKLQIVFGLTMSAWLLTGCNNEVDLLAPHQDIPVVYCILNQNDSVHYVRLEHSFAGAANAYEMAKEFDSIYYPEANVWLEEYKEREYTYFDDLISDNDASKLSDNIHNLLWSWFLDENGNDLSLIDGCSLGVAFCGSLEMLFATMYRYLCGLEKLLKRSHEVIFCNSSEDIFLDVIVSLQEKIGFSDFKIEFLFWKDA